MANSNTLLNTRSLFSQMGQMALLSLESKDEELSSILTPDIVRAYKVWESHVSAFIDRSAAFKKLSEKIDLIDRYGSAEKGCLGQAISKVQGVHSFAKRLLSSSYCEKTAKKERLLEIETIILNASKLAEDEKEQFILSSLNKKLESIEDFELIFDYIRAGLVKQKIFPGLLRALRDRNLLVDRDFLAALLRIISHLSPNLIVVSIQSIYALGSFPLHQKALLPELVKVLDLIDERMLADLLVLKDQHGNDFFSKEELFPFLMPYLSRLTPTNFIKVLSETTKYLKGPLAKEDFFICSMQLLNRLTDDDLLMVFQDLIKLQELNPTLLLELVLERSSYFWSRLLFLNDSFDRISLIQKFSEDQLRRIFYEILKKEAVKEIIKNGRLYDGSTLLFIEPACSVLYGLVLKDEDLREILFAKNRRGENFLHSSQLIKKLPYLKSLSKEDVSALFVQVDSKGETPFQTMIGINSEHNQDGDVISSTLRCTPEDFFTLLDFMRVFSVKELSTFLLSENNEGQSCLQMPAYKEPLYEFFFSLQPSELAELCIITDKKELPIFDSLPTRMQQFLLTTLKRETLLELFSSRFGEARLITYWDQLDVSLLIKLLEKTKFQRRPIIFCETGITIACQLIQKGIDPDSLLGLLKKQDGDYLTPLHQMGALRQIIEALISVNAKKEVFDSLLSLTDTHELTPFFDITSFSEVYSPLYSFDKQLLLKALMRRDRFLCTPLHDEDFLEIALPLTRELNVDLAKIRNLYALDPFSRAVFERRWIVSPKYGSMDLTPLSHEEFRAKVESVGTLLMKILDELEFHPKGEIPLTYLETSGVRLILEDPEIEEKIRRQKGEIRAAIAQITQNIRDQRAWLGTPSSADRESLGRFYLEMLLNLEFFAQFVEQQDPLVKAGSITELTRVVFEGRCAAAHQSEIAQRANIARFLLGQTTSPEEVIRGFLKGALIDIIDDIVKREYRSDVHYFNRLMFAAGLQANDDALCSRLTLDQAGEKIAAKLDFHRVAQKILKTLSLETLDEFIEDKIPADFDLKLPFNAKESSYLEIKGVFEVHEQRIGEKFQIALESITQNPSCARTLFDFFKLYRTPSLLGLFELFTKQAAIGSYVEAAFNQLDQSLSSKTKGNPTRLDIARVDHAKKNIQDAIEKIKHGIEQRGANLNLFGKIVQAFIVYQNDLITLSNEFPSDPSDDISYHFSYSPLTPLPSQAVEMARKLKFQEEFGWAGAKLTEILKILGIIRIERVELR